MPIYKLLEGGSFGPEDIERMAKAYEQSLKQLVLTDAHIRVKEIVAREVVAAAKRGLKDPDEICAEVIKRL